MTTDEKNREICSLLGIHWHEWEKSIPDQSSPYKSCRFMCTCGVKDCEIENPNFLDDAGAVRLLRELEKQEWGKLFFANLMYIGSNIEAIDDDNSIDRKFITTPGLLADKVIEWRRKKQW